MARNDSRTRKGLGGVRHPHQEGVGVTLSATLTASSK